MSSDLGGQMRQQVVQDVVLHFNLDDFDDDAEALEDGQEREVEGSCGFRAAIREDGCLVIAEPVTLTPFMWPRLELGDVIEVRLRSKKEYRFVRIVERGNPITWAINDVEELLVHSQRTRNVLEKIHELGGAWEHSNNQLTVQIPFEPDELESLRLELETSLTELDADELELISREWMAELGRDEFESEPDSKKFPGESNSS